MKRTYRQDRVTGAIIEVVPRETNCNSAPMVQPDAEAFVSPIDGSVIRGKRSLREHNKRHDVVQHREYGENEGMDYLKRRQEQAHNRLQGQTPQDRRERIAAIKRAMRMD